MKKLVTIIIPVYNEVYLTRSINSCLKQTYKEIEVLLVLKEVNNNTLKLVNYYKTVDKRINIVIDKNKMKNNLKNIGIENARGSYITFLNQIDYIDIDFVKDHMFYIDKCECDIVISGYSNDIKKFKKSCYNSNIYTDIMKNYLLMNIRSNHDAKIFKKSLFKEISFPATYFDNIQTMYKVYDKAKKVVKLSLREYYKENDEITLNDNEYMKKISYCIEMLDFIDTNYKDLSPYCKTKICCEAIDLMKKVNNKAYKKILYEYVKLFRNYAIKNKRLPKDIRFTVMKSVLGYNMLNIYLNLEKKD